MRWRLVTAAAVVSVVAVLPATLAEAQTLGMRDPAGDVLFTDVVTGATEFREWAIDIRRLRADFEVETRLKVTVSFADLRTSAWDIAYMYILPSDGSPNGYVLVAPRGAAPELRDIASDTRLPCRVSAAADPRADTMTFKVRSRCLDGLAEVRVQAGVSWGGLTPGASGIYEDSTRVSRVLPGYVAGD